MTFAPAPLIALGKYLVSQGAVNLGIVGDTAHATKGTSYHLGADRLKPWDPVTKQPYSIAHPRDRAGLSNAASAIDIGKVGGGYPGLRALSSWLASQCQRRAIDTLDIREVIYSPDGQKVFRWDEPTQTTYPGGTGTGQGDDSHLTHTHISFYRDSETRDKLAVFRRYFEEEDVQIKAYKGEDWKPTIGATGQSNGVYRATPDRSAPIVARLPAETIIRTLAEVSANGQDWRSTKVDGAPAYFLRGDLTPLVPGGDPATDAALTAYIARTPAPLPDCSAEFLKGRLDEYARMRLGTTATVTFPEPPA